MNVENETRDMSRVLEELEESPGQFRDFEIHKDGIFIHLSYSWHVLIPNSSQILNFVRNLKAGDNIAILREGSAVRIRKT